jgi:hypothetical protein
LLFCIYWELGFLFICGNQFKADTGRNCSGAHHHSVGLVAARGLVVIRNAAYVAWLACAACATVLHCCSAACAAVVHALP